MHLYRYFHRHPLSILLCLHVFLLGQALAASPQAQQSDQSALAWATKSVAALTGGIPVSSAVLIGAVVQGDHQDQGKIPIKLQATGTSTTEIDITTPKGIRSVTRSLDSAGRPSGMWVDANQAQNPIALHNCWTDAAWFFPALTQLTAYTDPNFVFLDLGQEKHQGILVEHIRVYRNPGENSSKAPLIALLSTVDYYLDLKTAVPLGMAFADHPNDDLLTDIPVKIEFSGYQLVGSRLVPYQITRFQHGHAQLEITISSVTLN